ncbi:MAG: 50S ribosomal protein L11 methyltransferase [Desulfocucumaceae bacterium]
MNWIEIAVSVRREDVDAASNIFEEIGTGGVVIEDPALIYEVISRGDSETVAMDTTAVDPQSPPVIKGYLQAGECFEKSLLQLRSALGSIDGAYPGRVTVRDIGEGNWMERWREFYHIFRVGRRLLVKPTWETAADTGGLLVIEMDPGMAFGCGTHSSTSMCMVLLENAVRGGETVLDVGTGSGILAIAAAKLGAARVLAVDYDETAVRTAWENVSINGLGDKVSVIRGNLLEGINDRAGIIVANIVADVILRLLPAAFSLLEEGGIFIASGIIAGRSVELEEALAGAGLVIREKLTEGEWTAFMAEKPRQVEIG